MTDAIPILRFRAGRVPCAVAARNVRGIHGAVGASPALWRLLALPPPPVEDREAAAAWVLELPAPDTSVGVSVQGPIEIVSVGAGDILRRPPALVLDRADLILGFVQLAREPVLLVDIPTLLTLIA